MAEQVQAALDQMVAPLRDLMDRNIFTEQEIRAIVNRRRESEYLLRRRAARKADFVRYIEAEMLLEKLRALRTAKKKRDHRKAQRERGINDDDNDNEDDDDDDLDEDGNPKANSKTKQNQKEDDDPIGDVHVVQHIHLLFVRAIRKFRSDLALHLQHAEFCKSVKSWTRLGRVYAEALQIFPREAGIWIEAASNEFFGPNRSVQSARVLMQRGLRLNGKSSEELWLQYFTLELHYAQTLKGRRKILRPETETGDNSNDENDSDSDSDGDSDGEPQHDASGEPHDYNKIPMVILRNAIRSIHDDVRFRLKFLDACQQFPDTADLMEYVQESMANDFADKPESWIARAIYQAEKQRKEINGDEPKAKRARTEEKNEQTNDAVISVLTDAIDTLGTTEMLLQAFRFAEDYRMELEHNGEEDPSVDSSHAIEQVDVFIDRIWSRAKDGSIAGDSSELAIEQTRYLLRQGQEEDALRTIKDHCTTRSLPTATASPSASVVPSEAWLLWAGLSPSLKKQKGILKRALQSIPVDQHPDYVVVLLQYLGAQLKAASRNENRADTSPETNLFETLQNLLLLAPKTVGDVSVEEGSTGLDFELHDVFEGYTACLDHFYERRGISGARKIYEAVLFRSTAVAVVSSKNEGGLNPVKGFVDRCFELEQQPDKNSPGSTSARAKTKRRFLCKLYDRAIDIFEGTQLEESYRYDRNEIAVFA